ncbi:MAG: hypothetical protein V3U75_13325 [Methylococcaceae bacterium]
MTNKYEQYVTPTPPDAEKPASTNPYTRLTSGATVDVPEQETIGKINSVTVKSPDSFGLTQIPADVGKGFARVILSTPQLAGATLVEAGELAAAAPEGETTSDTLKRHALNFLIKRLEPAGLDNLPGIFGLAQDVIGTEVAVFRDLVLDKDNAKAVSKAGYNMIKTNQQALEGMNLIPKGETSVAYDVGAGFASLGISIGATMITKNPALATAYMGWAVNSQDYLEAREAGKIPEEAAAIAAQSAAGQAMIEFIGGKYFLSAAKSNSVIRKILGRTLGQSIEEGLQTGVELGIKNIHEVRDTKLQDALMEMGYSAFIGAMVGAPISTLSAGVESIGQAKGVPKELAKYAAEKLTENYTELQDAGIALMDKETSGLGREQTTIDASTRAVKEVIQNKEAELTAQAEEGAAVEDVAQQEVAVEVTNVAEAVEGAVSTVSQTVQKSAQALDAQALKLINDKLALLEDKKSLFAETAAGKLKRGKIRATEDIATDLDLIDRSISEVDSALRNAGVDPTALKDLKAAQRQIRRNRLQAERVTARAERAAVTPEIGVSEEQRQADYEEVAGTTKAGIKARAKTATGNIFEGVAEIGSDVFTPVSTRLGKINVKLKIAVRKYTFNTGMHLTQDKKTIKPFVDSIGKMGEADYRVLDLALKNKDNTKVNELLAKYDMTESFANVQNTLDELFDQSQEVGVDMHYVDDYFPRQVRRGKVGEYLAVLRGQENWSEIQAALLEVDPENTYTDAEKADFINSYLRGFTSKRILLAAGGFTKERAVDYVTPEFNQYYESSPQALVRYVDGMRYGIEARRLFGRDNAENSIGDYVRDLVEEGAIDSKNEEEVQKILRAVVDQQGTRGVVTWAKNASYIAVMGSPISAITQIGDLAFSLAENGYYNSAKALGKAVFRRSKFTKESVGIEHVLQEFEGENTSAKAVRKVFKIVGLEYIDNLGKETNMNAAFARLQKQAKQGSDEFKAYMEVAFGNEAEQTTKDLIAGNSTDNVKFLVFSELSDVQPVSLAEMPIGYLRGGNMRVLYMLKTYTLKLLDIHRRKWFDEIASGNPKRMAKGTQNLVRLGTALVLMGMSADALKDLLLDRDFEAEDLLVENLIKMTGINRYQVQKSKRQGIFNTFWQFFIPPIGTVADDLVKDLSQIGLGDKKLEDARTAKDIPVGGKLYYWWFGGGKKHKNRKKKRSNVSTF